MKDQEVRQESVMNAYRMLETLAYLDRQVTGIRDEARSIKPDIPKSLVKKLDDVQVQMDSLHSKMVATKEGKVTGEERLREKIAFIYGTILSYHGKPTDSQVSGLNSLEKEVEKISKNITNFMKKDLLTINQELVKANITEIRILSEEEFRKE